MKTFYSRFPAMCCRKLSFLGIVTMLSAATLTTLAQSDADVVASFKKYMTNYVASYKTDRREQVDHKSGGWSRKYFELGADYSIDVRKTDSLISPYAGFAELVLTMHSTAFHKTQVEAETDHNFIESYSMKRRNTYAYQDGGWILKSRQEYVSVLGKWSDCDHDGCIGEGAQ